MNQLADSTKDWAALLNEAILQEVHSACDIERSADGAITAARQLISMYDAPFCWNLELRRLAAAIVATLAAASPAILELVIINAEEYGKHQHIDDADPYNPNSFDVLATVKPTERTIAFLQNVVQTDSGTARDSAARALMAVSTSSCPEALLAELPSD